MEENKLCKLYSDLIGELKNQKGNIKSEGVSSSIRTTINLLNEALNKLVMEL